MSNGVEPNSPVHKVWKPERNYLTVYILEIVTLEEFQTLFILLIVYKIQLEAPAPKAILREGDISDNESHPNFYGYEYHGVMSHKESERMLEGKYDGSYLVRRSPGAVDYYTLSLRFDKRTKHYKIYHKSNCGHYLKEDFKRFESVHDLVADGLVNFYMQIHAAPIIKSMLTQTRNNYQQSPYMTLNRRKLRALSNDLRKSLKIDIGQPSNENVNGTSSSLDAAISNPPPHKSQQFKEKETEINQINGNSQQQIATAEEDVLPIVYEKSHKFKIQTFKLQWCEFCGNFLFGFTLQGVKCEDCGFIAHKKCSELVPPKCVPDLKKIRGVFGSDLTTVVTALKCIIPFVIKRCVEEVEARGMLQEGIYRVSGFADEIDALKMALDRDGEKTDMSETAYSNVNVIAGTLKLYLRLLPVPLITYHAYPTFIKSTGEFFLYYNSSTHFLYFIDSLNLLSFRL